MIKGTQNPLTKANYPALNIIGIVFGILLILAGLGINPLNW